MSMLANRLQKNLARLKPWASREGLDAWRLYDRDIPERPWMIDLYGDQVLISEYVTPRGMRLAEDVREAERQEVADAVAEVLGTPPSSIHAKVRQRHVSIERQSQGTASHEFTVQERGHRFLVNLDDYLDTGLFLDHRDARKRVGLASAGKRVLNLFCYTGAFTIYAAAGGATATTSVDLSATYLSWAERNLRLNGVQGAAHRLVRADALEFLRETTETFDLIVLDPPTLSRSKQAAAFDVQKDHVAAINLALRQLTPGGWLLFSTNSRQFVLDERSLHAGSIRDITAATMPKDHREAVHRAWELREPRER